MSCAWHRLQIHEDFKTIMSGQQIARAVNPAAQGMTGNEPPNESPWARKPDPDHQDYPAYIRYLATHPEAFTPTYVRKADRQRFLAGRDKQKMKEYLDQIMDKLDP